MERNEEESSNKWDEFENTLKSYGDLFYPPPPPARTPFGTWLGLALIIGLLSVVGVLVVRGVFDLSERSNQTQQTDAEILSHLQAINNRLENIENLMTSEVTPMVVEPLESSNTPETTPTEQVTVSSEPTQILEPTQTLEPTDTPLPQSLEMNQCSIINGAEVKLVPEKDRLADATFSLNGQDDNIVISVLGEFTDNNNDTWLVFDTTNAVIRSNLDKSDAITVRPYAFIELEPDFVSECGSLNPKSDAITVRPYAFIELEPDFVSECGSLNPKIPLTLTLILPDRKLWKNIEDRPNGDPLQNPVLGAVKVIGVKRNANTQKIEWVVGIFDGRDNNWGDAFIYVGDEQEPFSEIEMLILATMPEYSG